MPGRARPKTGAGRSRRADANHNRKESHMNHGEKTAKEAMSGVMAELAVKDGQLRAAFVIRDKQNPYAEPTTLRVMSLDDIKSFVDAVPDQVHYLALSKDEEQRLIKLSLSSRSHKYNVHCGQTNHMGFLFDGALFARLEEEIGKDLMPHFMQFLSE